MPSMLFLTDPVRTPEPWVTAARLPVGAAVIYRHFGAADAPEVAARLRDVTREAGVLLLIGLDAALAERVGADGVHLPERASSAAYALGGRRPDWLLTGAAHSTTAVAAARDLDAVIVSPVFRAGGVSAASEPLGLPTLDLMTTVAPCGVYALGGIDAETAPDLIGTGVCGFGAVAAIRDAF